MQEIKKQLSKNAKLKFEICQLVTDFKASLDCKESDTRMKIEDSLSKKKLSVENLFEEIKLLFSQKMTPNTEICGKFLNF